MNPKVCLAVATLAVVCQVSSAVFFFESAAAGAAGSITLSSSSLGAGLAVGGGLLLLKGLALGALAASNRGRRSAPSNPSLDNDAAAFAVIAQVEPAQCYRRLICDLATGSMASSENDVILSLFNKEASIASPKFEYATAAKLGRELKDVQTCELRYSCPVSGEEIQALFA